jgi:hypothetical protein
MTDFSLIRMVMRRCRSGEPIGAAYGAVAVQAGVERGRVVDAYCKALVGRMAKIQARGWM